MTYQVCDTRGAVLAKAGSLEEAKALAATFAPPVLVRIYLKRGLSEVWRRE